MDVGLAFRPKTASGFMTVGYSRDVHIEDAQVRSENDLCSGLWGAVADMSPRPG